jgi:hypothetical protein
MITLRNLPTFLFVKGPVNKKSMGIRIIAAINPPIGARVTRDVTTSHNNFLLINNTKTNNNSENTQKNAKLQAVPFKSLNLFLYILFTKE